MPGKDVKFGFIIGGAVGILVQPILNNVGAKISFVGSAPSLEVRLVAFLIFLVLGPLGLLIGYLLGKLHEVIYQFIKFCAIGTLNSFINLGALNLLILVSGVSTGYIYDLFVFIGFLLATTNSYFWNRFWTFKEGDRGHTSQTIGFYAIAAVGAFINVGVAAIVVNGVGHNNISSTLWANVGGLLGIAASFIWNFIGYKFFVFKKK